MRLALLSEGKVIFKDLTLILHEKNIVIASQQRLGWTDDEGRKEIMGYYYKHRGCVPEFAVAI